MPKNKKAISNEATPTTKITRVPIKKRKKIIPGKEKPYEFAIISPSDLWSSFDNVFSRFRNDFEDLLFPSPWNSIFPAIPETRIPLVDLEDQGKNFLMKAEMPGFKREEIDLDVQENSISISAEVGWSYDKKEQKYVCKERACKSFFRTIQLSEDIDVEKTSAELCDGVLEVNLPKKKPKKRRKISIK